MNYFNTVIVCVCYLCDDFSSKTLNSRHGVIKHWGNKLRDRLVLANSGGFHKRSNASSRVMMLITEDLSVCI